MSSSNTFFRFRQFVVHQERAAMKVGTDGVLLGALAEMPPGAAAPQRVLDIGTGTGLVALMVAQRFPRALVTAVEIDPGAAAQARDNCLSSPFADRMEVVEADANALPPTACDLVVCNPPFFAEQLQCPDGRRNMARHSVGLTFADVARVAASMLVPGGRLAVVVPFDSAPRLASAATLHGLRLARRTTVYSVRRKPPRRAVCQFERAAGPAEALRDELTLLAPDGRMTREYAALTGEFYL